MRAQAYKAMFNASGSTPSTSSLALPPSIPATDLTVDPVLHMLPAVLLLNAMKGMKTTKGTDISITEANSRPF